MRLPLFLRDWLATRVALVMDSRPPDFVIGTPADPYLLRWFVIPRNRLFNIYAHKFCRSDDDRALHDHPWLNLSVLVLGTYTEHTIAAGGIHVRRVRKAGEWTFRRPRDAHRIELHEGTCWTLFITGPRVRTWGFHCPDAGWIGWKTFTKAGNSGEIGPGCDAPVDRPSSHHSNHPRT